MLIEIPMRAGILGVRDAIPEDVGLYINYWHYSGDRIIKFLRIDQARLGGPEDSEKRFMSMIRKNDKNQKSVIFSIVLNERVIGYTNINMYGAMENYPHFHTYLHSDRATIRAALSRATDVDIRNKQDRTAGIAAVLVGATISTCFSIFDIERIVLQTRPTSIGINKALDHYSKIQFTRFCDKPDGLAGPGDFHVRYAYRKDAPFFREKSTELATSINTSPAETGGQYST